MWFCFFFQAEDGIRDLVRSRGLGDVYKRQGVDYCCGGKKPLADAVKDAGLDLKTILADLEHTLLSLIHI